MPTHDSYMKSPYALVADRLDGGAAVRVGGPDVVRATRVGGVADAVDGAVPSGARHVHVVAVRREGDLRAAGQIRVHPPQVQVRAAAPVRGGEEDLVSVRRPSGVVVAEVGGVRLVVAAPAAAEGEEEQDRQVSHGGYPGGGVEVKAFNSTVDTYSTYPSAAASV